VVRIYKYFASLPSADCRLIGTALGGLVFKQSDSKLYAWSNANGFATSGITLTTGQWYEINFGMDATEKVVRGNVDGTELATIATTYSGGSQCFIGVVTTLVTCDLYLDDAIVSNTLADYPIGPGYVNHFVPTSDGTHNVAGANDFERSATGTDITNATTTAYQLIDDVPLKSGVLAEYINAPAPPNATDYVEVVYGPAPGISTPTVAPRAVEVICAYGSASAGTNNTRLALNDNGTTDDVLNTTTGPGTTATYARKHYATAPTGGAWTLSGAGNFNNLRMRFLTNDAAPDPWFGSTMIEAEFAEVVGGGRTTKNTRAFPLGTEIGMNWRGAA
jgi:hypothetical protein